MTRWSKEVPAEQQNLTLNSTIVCYQIDKSHKRYNWLSTGSLSERGGTQEIQLAV